MNRKIIKQIYRDQSLVENYDQYCEIYKNSINKNDIFWSDVAKRISWYQKWNKVSDVNFKTADINWYLNGKLNVSYNCIDRHIENGYGDKKAIIWQGDDEDEYFYYSYIL